MTCVLWKLTIYVFDVALSNLVFSLRILRVYLKCYTIINFLRELLSRTELDMFHLWYVNIAKKPSEVLSMY